ncbi:MAG: hypothetical protein ACP6IP_06410 [Candidatus Njordarchaeia archaeon]
MDDENIKEIKKEISNIIESINDLGKRAITGSGARELEIVRYGLISEFERSRILIKNVKNLLGGLIGRDESIKLLGEYESKISECLKAMKDWNTAYTFTKYKYRTNCVGEITGILKGVLSTIDWFLYISKSQVNNVVDLGSLGEKIDALERRISSIESKYNSLRDEIMSMLREIKQYLENENEFEDVGEFELFELFD